jgi:colicin import membrane protein
MLLIIKAILFREYILGRKMLEMANSKNKPSSFALAKERIIRYFAAERKEQLLVVSTARLQKKFKRYYAAVHTKGITIFVCNKARVGKVEVVEEREWFLFNRVVIDHYFMKSIFSFEGDEGMEWKITIKRKGKEVQRAIENHSSLGVVVVRRSFSRKVIGFRSLKLWKMLMATFFYSIFMLSFIGNYIPLPTQQTFASYASILFVIIFFIMMIGFIRPRWVLPKLNDPTRKKVAHYYSYVLIFLLAMMGAFAEVKEKEASPMVVATTNTDVRVAEEAEKKEIAEAERQSSEEVEKTEKEEAERQLSAEAEEKGKEVAEYQSEEKAEKKEKEKAERRLAEEAAKKEKEEAKRQVAEKAEKKEKAESQAKLEADRQIKEQEVKRASEQRVREAPTYQAAPERKQTHPNASYENCSEVKAAGAAPIRRGEPGYSSKLDRDGDGIGCER